MQLTRCPVCHSRINLETLIQDEAGRDLLALLIKLDKPAPASIVSYIGLFRAASRDLANDRALRLCGEVLELGALNLLLPALQHTIESMRAKQISGQFKPLTNHNYLKRVLENTAITPLVGIDNSQPIIETYSPRNARRKITAAIMDVHDTNW